MLSKRICRQCVKKAAACAHFDEDSNETLEEMRARLGNMNEFDKDWENYWNVYCPAWDIWPAIKIYHAPPRNCPYIAEHIIDTVDENPEELFAGWARYDTVPAREMRTDVREGERKW